MAEITATPATQVRSDTFGGSPAANEMAKDAIVTTTGVAKASTTGDAGQKNPFVDPVAEQVNAGEEAVFAVDATLAVGKGGSASLTLATDCLIVLGISTHHDAEKGETGRMTANDEMQMKNLTTEAAVNAAGSSMVCSVRFLSLHASQNQSLFCQHKQAKRLISITTQAQAIPALYPFTMCCGQRLWTTM